MSSTPSRTRSPLAASSRLRGEVARATAALAAAEAGERGPLQSQGHFRRRAEFEAEGLDDDSILEAMGEERMIESGRWEAGYAGFGH
jgi:hypothetical protein